MQLASTFRPSILTSSATLPSLSASFLSDKPFLDTFLVFLAFSIRNRPQQQPGECCCQQVLCSGECFLRNSTLCFHSGLEPRSLRISRYCPQIGFLSSGQQACSPYHRGGIRLCVNCRSTCLQFQYSSLFALLLRASITILPFLSRPRLNFAILTLVALKLHQYHSFSLLFPFHVLAAQLLLAREHHL